MGKAALICLNLTQFCFWHKAGALANKPLCSVLQIFMDPRDSTQAGSVTKIW